MERMDRNSCTTFKQSVFHYANFHERHTLLITFCGGGGSSVQNFAQIVQKM
jgi:hypothetical protein